MSSMSSAPTSPMRQTYVPARRSVIKPDVVNGVCPLRAYTVFGDAHGRSESRSHRPAIVCRSGARRDLCAVCDRPFTDLRHADRGQLRPRCVLYGWSLCRALHALARRQFLDLPDRGAAGRRLVRSCRRTKLDTAALRKGARLAVAADGWVELRDG